MIKLILISYIILNQISGLKKIQGQKEGLENRWQKWTNPKSRQAIENLQQSRNGLSRATLRCPLHSRHNFLIPFVRLPSLFHGYGGIPALRLLGYVTGSSRLVYRLYSAPDNKPVDAGSFLLHSCQSEQTFLTDSRR